MAQKTAEDLAAEAAVPLPPTQESLVQQMHRLEVAVLEAERRYRFLLELRSSVAQQVREAVDAFFTRNNTTKPTWTK